MAETTEIFASAVIARLVGTPDETVAHAAREYVLTYYAWAARFAELGRLLAPAGAGAMSASEIRS